MGPTYFPADKDIERTHGWRIMLDHDVGDLFSVVYSDSLETLYIGCQNTSIQQFDLSVKEKYRSLHLPNTCKCSKFFDTLPPKLSDDNKGIMAANVYAEISYIPKNEIDDVDIPRYEIDDTMVYWNSHNGYVYALLLGKNKDDAGVLTITLHEDLLFCGAQDVMLYALSKLVSLRTVSGNDKYLEECFRGAKLLKSIFEQLGAEAFLLPGIPGRNPLVIGKFLGIKDNELATASTNVQKTLNILVYGHYDIVDAEEEAWLSNPFEMLGPMLAAIFAASELRQEKGLKTNVSFLIEGEEENGSEGFHNIIDNSKTPCLTYGLRGVIRATIEISSSKDDVHSGVEGGAVSESLNDLIRVLAKLVSNDNQILIPDIKNSLMSRWRHPTLTIHKIDVSGPNNVTVIPRSAKAAVSMRIVPDQDLEEIAANFVEYVELVFGELKTDNTIKVADWWLGDPENRFFKAAEETVRQEWGVNPLYVREGGSIPAIRWLEKKFNAVVVNLPMGQVSFKIT
ncbi:4253_t:CDS:10 [Racocetra fulgida]|uniref:4253_t:CDS:1 n=1 Tax=Racocetra fulgida TaxID=60492 RepID=A0A9N9AC75_9GLOM|nr:4253_t:CDS:10 [Racocetra fulgida]